MTSFADPTQTPATPAPSTEVQPQAQLDPQVEFEIGGRKYNVDAAQKKILNADTHIAKLESERAADRQRIAELTSQANRVRELEAVLAGTIAPPATPTVAPAITPAQVQVDPVQLALDTASIVRNDMNREANFNEVAATLAKRYGASVDKVVYGTMEGLGYTQEEVIEMAKSKPKALIAMFANVPAPSPTPTSSTVNASGVVTPAPRQAKGPSIMDARTDAERIAIYTAAVREAERTAA